MKRLPILLSLLPFVATSLCGQTATTSVQTFGDASPLEWSRRMADSEIARRGDTMFHGGSNPRARWDYTTSLLGLSLQKLAAATDHRAYADYGAKTVTSFIGSDGAIATYRMEEYNI